MTLKKHTPGPWTIQQELDGGPWYSINSTEEYGWVCQVPRPNHPDARLIAAAPEMLEALKVAREMLEEMRPHSDGLAQVRGAIAKALKGGK